MLGPTRNPKEVREGFCPPENYTILGRSKSYIPGKVFENNLRQYVMEKMALSVRVITGRPNRKRTI